jgi:hypothetical protein
MMSPRERRIGPRVAHHGRSSGAVVTILYALTRLAFSDVPDGGLLEP